MAFSLSPESEWYKQQTETLSEALHELVSDDNPALAAKGISDAIKSWTANKTLIRQPAR